MWKIVDKEHATHGESAVVNLGMPVVQAREVVAPLEGVIISVLKAGDWHIAIWGF